MTGAALAEALGARRSGAGWLARCVAHEDREPSLSVGEGDDGRPLVHCHAGCSQDDVLAALAARGLWADAADRRDTAKQEARRADAPTPEDLGPPTEAQIAALIHSRRLTTAATLERVGARLVRCWGDEWLNIPTLSGSSKLLAVDAAGRPRRDARGKLARRNLGPVSIVAPRELRERNGSTIGRLYDVEGESDLLAILDAGASAAVSTTGGAASLAGHEQARDWLEGLEAREVVVVRDRDDAGRKGVAVGAEWWRRAGARVRVLELPEALGDGGDVRDFLLGRPARPGTEATAPLGTLADLDALADAAPVLEPILDAQKLLAELAALDPLAYDQRREEAAKRLGVRKGALDAAVMRRREEAGDAEAADAGLLQQWEVEPWLEPVAGAALLDELVAVFSRYVVLPSHGAEALALWTLHAWAHDAATVSPLIVLASPEKRCGKTTALLVLRYAAPRPLPAANVTAAVLFRAVERWRPTLLVDEADTFLAEDDELRGIINSGHVRAMAQTIRCVGDEHEPRTFATWAPKALAIIGKFHDTLRDRSIVLEMRRRLPSERVERLRGDADSAFVDLRRRAARWAADTLEQLRGADPALPDELGDRAADNWRPLVGIADLAGAEWPDLARSAALGLSGAGATDTGSIRTLLLADLASLLEETGGRIASAKLAERLAGVEERPWGEWGKDRKPITARQVAALLRPFAVAPRPLRIDGEPTKGYDLEDLKDTLARYLPRRSVTRLQPAPDKNGSGFPIGYASEPVTDGKTRKSAPDKACNRVTDGKGENRPGGDNEPAGDTEAEAEWTT